MIYSTWWLREGSAKLDLLMGKAYNGDFIRAGGDCICEKCGREYRQHPAWQESPTFFGVCRGKGLNMLGIILMRVRAEVRESFVPHGETF